MAKCILRLASFLTILFLTVPLLAALGSEHTYSLPIGSDSDRVCLKMPDGQILHISQKDFFAGTAAAFLPDETDEDTLRAACVLLNTPELTENGVFYLTEKERSLLFGSESKEKQQLYYDIWESTKNQSLVLSGGDLLSITEYMELLPTVSGDYDEKLASLFPGGGLIKKQEKPELLLF